MSSTISANRFIYRPSVSVSTMRPLNLRLRLLQNMKMLPKQSMDLRFLGLFYPKAYWTRMQLDTHYKSPVLRMSKLTANTQTRLLKKIIIKSFLTNRSKALWSSTTGFITKGLWSLRWVKSRPVGRRRRLDPCKLFRLALRPYKRLLVTSCPYRARLSGVISRHHDPLMSG